jgi:hypothetical protein
MAVSDPELTSLAGTHDIISLGMLADDFRRRRAKPASSARLTRASVRSIASRVSPRLHPAWRCRRFRSRISNNSLRAKR